MDNLLAGIAEKVCDDIGLPRPAWTRRVHSLKDRWLGSGIPRMQADAIAATTFESVVESLLAQLLSAAEDSLTPPARRARRVSARSRFGDGRQRKSNARRARSERLQRMAP